MDVVFSLSKKMDEFIELKQNVVKMGGNKNEIITKMEDITRRAFSGSKYLYGTEKDWGLITISLYIDQKQSLKELNDWGHDWHDLINECILVNDGEAGRFLHASINGGLF